jgi:hypothetical protein
MKYLLLIATLALAGCEMCNDVFITDSDNGACARTCAFHAASSDTPILNTYKCIRVACQYPTKRVCE